jgi:hypothetical protein
MIEHQLELETLAWLQGIGYTAATTSRLAAPRPRSLSQALLSANRHFQRLLVGGVPVQYPMGG